MTDDKNKYALRYGIGSTIMAAGCTVGMIFTGPTGWLILGACAGAGSGMATSSVQQYFDSSQREFDFERLAQDGLIGGALSILCRGDAVKNLAQTGFLIKESKRILFTRNIAIPAMGVREKNDKYYHNETKDERNKAEQVAENKRNKHVVKDIEGNEDFKAFNYIYNSSYIDSKDQQYVLFMSLIEYEDVVCYAKGLATEYDTGVTLDEKLASWQRAREIEVGPRFKQIGYNPIADPQESETNTEDQHWIVVEAGMTLQQVLSQGEQSLAQLRSFKDQVRKIFEKLKNHRLAHQDIKPANIIVIGSTIYLIDNDHLRGFGERRTVSAGQAADSNGQRFAASSNGIKLSDMKCDVETDAKGFKLIENMLATRIANQINVERKTAGLQAHAMTRY